MKICIINNIYSDSNKSSGSERIAKHMAEELTRQGHNVFIIATGNNTSHDAAKRIYRIKSVFGRLPGMPMAIRLIWHWWDAVNLVSYFKIRKILSREKPDITISHNLKGLGLVSARAIRSYGGQHIHILHDLQLIYPSGLLYWGREGVLRLPWSRLYGFISRICVGSPVKVIAPSSWLLDLHRKAGFFRKAKHAVVLNPIMVDTGDSISASKTSYSEFAFLYVGQINNAKGVDILLDAYEVARKGIAARIKLVIIGYGERKKEWQTKYEQREDISIPEEPSHQDVLAAMYATDCLVVPSRCYENSPTVIYEAAGTGLPVIAANIGGIPELISVFGGKLFTPDNSKDLANAMLWAYDNRLDMINAARLAMDKIGEYNTRRYLKSLLSA